MKLETVSCVVCRSPAAGTLLAQGADYDYGTTGETFTFVRCHGCGHCYLNPRPAPEDAPEIYPSNYYTLDGSHQTGRFHFMGALKDAVVVRRLKGLLRTVPTGGQVVDLGCGDGALLLAIRRVRPDTRLIGVDLALSHSRRTRMEAAGITCIEAKLESANLPLGLDLVIMNQVIEHLWEVDACLAKISASLRTGGLLSVCTPNSDAYDARWFRTGAWGGYYFPRHLNLFNRKSLTQVLTRHHLRLAEWRQLVAPLVWASTLRALQVRQGWPRLTRPLDSNLLVLAVFSLLDRLVIATGGISSNQQIVVARE